MEWNEVLPSVAEWQDKTASVARNIRSRITNVYTEGDIGFYFNPYIDKVAMFPRLATKADTVRGLYAIERAVGDKHTEDHLLSEDEVKSGEWIKVAYSPTLRTLGENLNFFPGHHLGVIPNSPSPLAALLTTAIVGGGSGWLLGKLAKKLLPGGFGRNLPRTGATLGAVLGGAAASPWAISNLQQGKSLLDGSLLADPPGTKPVVDPDGISKEGFDVWTKEGLSPQYLESVAAFCKEAFQSGELFSLMPKMRSYSPLDVHVNSLNQTLYESDAGPQLTTAALGTMYAASQFPDPRARQGWVTGQQLGQLAVNAAGDYAKGLLVGGILNATVGTPFRTPVIAAGNVALGIIGSVLPKLFGS